MRQKKALKSIFITGNLASLLMFTPVHPQISFAAAGEDQQAMRYAKIIDRSGTVEVLAPGARDWVDAQKGMILQEGYKIRTKSKSSVDLEIAGGEVSEVRLMEKSELKLDLMTFDPDLEASNTLLDLAVGKVLVTSEDLSSDSDYNVQTPTSLVGIRGTSFLVEAGSE